MKDIDLSPMDFHFPIFVKACIAKGGFKILVLSILQSKPMHGYEISSTIQERSHGFYRPSPGSIYPTLRSLLETGNVSVIKKGEKKIYKITPSGRRFLKKRKDQIVNCMQAFEKSFGPERQKLMREMKKTGRLLAAAGKNITPDQAAELSELFKQMREKMLQIIAE